MKVDFKKQLKNPKMDFSKLKVILIGISKYPDDKQVNDVPNIRKNISLMKKAFTDKSMSIPNSNIFVSMNKSKIVIEKQLTDFVRNTNFDETLLVYYSGHGFISTENNKLYLSTKNTNLDYIESTSISIERIVEIISYSYSQQKILIMDSCYSGHIHNMFNNPNSGIYNRDKTDNLYVITSSSGDKPSFYPTNSKNLPTYFTGSLLEVLKEGIPNDKYYLTMNQVYNAVRNSLRNMNLPLPQKTNNGDRIFISYNKCVFDYENNNEQKIYFSKLIFTFLLNAISK